MKNKKNKIESSDEMCYTPHLIMKAYIKLALTCAFSVAVIAATLTGITFGIVSFKNSSGRGGYDSQSSIHVSSEIFSEQLPSFIAEEKESDLRYFSYRIKQGDMIGVIADKYGITQDTIISVNNIRASRLIQIGQYLKIPSMPGILYTVHEDGETAETIAEKYGVDAVKCSSVNGVSLDESLASGKSLFVPDAKLDWMTRQEINGDLFIKPLHARFVYTSMYGWRKNPFDSEKRTFHSGIDMACGKGTPIYAANVGRVTESGWSDIYGNYVIVAHYSGYSTLYGHMSVRNVERGQYVTTETMLGRVGSTGQSTGPHLHFAVYKNGRSLNPVNFWL